MGKKFLFLAIALFVFAFSSMSAKDRLLRDSITENRIYPGAVHSFTVSLPASANGEVGLLLSFDGDVFSARKVVDELAEKGEMPPVVIVGLNPGVVRDSSGRVIRYNRSNEFDALDNRMARFIERNLIPKVSKMVSKAGVKLSNNPDLHAVMGASSGGIAAFIVAWHSPHLFHRVYSSAGTFVAMRGGDALPAIIRKTETKPIRIFLHDGKNDVWNPLFGNWFEANQLMESALTFAGYEVAHSWDDGNHSISGGIKALPDAMRWLWHNWQIPVSSSGKSGNDMLKSILRDGEEWTWTSENVEFPDYSTITASDGSTFGSANGPAIALSPDNKILVEAEINSNWLIASVVGDNGRLSYRQRFYWLHNIDNSTETYSRQMAFDEDGNLYVATSMGVQVCDQNGRVRAILPLPFRESASALMFKGNSLYVKSGVNVYVRKLKVRGYDNSTSPIVPKSQGQA